MSQQTTIENNSIDSNNLIASPDKTPVVNGQLVNKLPEDLYIPPDALEVFLESFEGPLDLLLYLIKKNNLDIMNIQVAVITEQYMEYVRTMQQSRFELAAEYLVMAATLIEIKSFMLLPKMPSAIEEDEVDPRAELVKRLQIYETIKQAAENLDAMPRLNRDIWSANTDMQQFDSEVKYTDIKLSELLTSLATILNKAELFETHTVTSEGLSVKQRMEDIIELLRTDRFTPFVALFDVTEGKLGIVVTFAAVLELVKEFIIDIVQNEPYGPIYTRRR